MEREFELLARSGLLPEACFGPFRDHALSDADSNHSDRFRQVFLEFETIAGTTAGEAHRNLWRLAHAYRFFYAGMLDFYRESADGAWFGFEF